ncbi:MAG: hypothetical protein Q8P81_00235 [Nanoarchaeota archaeon]|nr:hypothetical protein [Nanoarchaeota archaeon]
MDYKWSLAEDGRTVVSLVDDGSSRFDGVLGAIRNLENLSDFECGAVKKGVEGEVLDTLGHTGYFGLRSFFSERPSCYLRDASEGRDAFLEVCFHRYKFGQKDGFGMQKSVDVSLFVEPQEGSKLLSDLVISGFPSDDLLRVYLTVSGNPFDFERSDGERVKGIRIMPATAGAEALNAMTRLSDLYSRLDRKREDGSWDSPRGTRFDEVSKRKREVYGLNLLEILGVDVFSGE